MLEYESIQTKAVTEYIESERKKDKQLRMYTVVFLVLATITLICHVYFDYKNEVTRKKRADANQVEFDKAVRWYYDTTNVRKTR